MSSVAQLTLCSPYCAVLLLLFKLFQKFHTEGTYQLEYKGETQALSAAATGKNKKESGNKFHEELNKKILESVDLIDKCNEPGSVVPSTSTAASKQVSQN